MREWSALPRSRSYFSLYVLGIVLMAVFLCPSHQEVALAISPLAGIGTTWNSPFQGQVRAAFPLSGMFPYKDKLQNLFLLIDIRKEKSQHLLTRETLRKASMKIFSLLVSRVYTAMNSLDWNPVQDWGNSWFFLGSRGGAHLLSDISFC